MPVTLDKNGKGKEMMEHATYATYNLLKDANGNPYTIPGFLGSYQEQNTPIAMMHVNPTKKWAHKIMPKFNLDLQIWDNIKYHFTYNAELSFWGNEGADTQLYYLSNNNNVDKTNASMYKGQNYRWQIENTITWDKQFGKHGIGVVLGQSAEKFTGDELGGNRNYLVNVNKPSINYATGNIDFSYVTDGDGNTILFKKDDNGNYIIAPDGNPMINGATVRYGVYGGPYAQHRMASLFGRVSYNYDEKYMIQAIIHRDGSSRFGSNNKYGVFPSVSVGWNVMNEKFMQETSSWLNNLKIRASWAKTSGLVVLIIPTTSTGTCSSTSKQTPTTLSAHSGLTSIQA